MKKGNEKKFKRSIFECALLKISFSWSQLTGLMSIGAHAIWKNEHFLEA